MLTETIQSRAAQPDISHNLQAMIAREVKLYVAGNKSSKAPYLFLKCSIYLIGIGLAYSLMLAASSLSVLITAYCVYGLLLILFGLNFAHDLSHNSVFKNKAVNNSLFETIFMSLGVSGYLWKERHVSSHHEHPNTEGHDPDLDISSIINLSPFKKTKAFHRYQYIYAPLLYATYTLYWMFIKDFVLIIHRRNRKVAVPGQNFFQLVKLCLIKAIYLFIMLYLPFVTGNWPIINIVLAFAAMHIIGSYFLLFTFLITHHVEETEYFNPKNPNENNSWFYRQIRSSNDFHPFSTAANFIFGGFNCHIAHHLFPNTSHVYYPAISRIIYRHLRRQNIIPNNTTYFGGILSHLRILKLYGETC